MAENKKCRVCQKDFVVEDDEIKFLNDVSPEINGQKFDLPTPAQCPICRSRNRLIYRNLRNLSKRKDDATGKEIFTHFDETVKFPVYDADYWWGDGWDGTKYGRDWDPNRKFFEQFQELYNSAPASARYTVNVEDCDYTNGIDNCKHCFLSFGIGESENCFYCSDTRKARDCVDCFAITDCEGCYECIRCRECYDLRYSIRSTGCRESYFLADCKSCSNCIGCCNLANKQYHIFNEQVTPEEYNQKVAELSDSVKLAEFAKEFEQFSIQQPKRYYYGTNCENCTGDDVKNAKNARNTFYAGNVEDVIHCNYVFDAKNCMDYNIYGDHSEWIYQGIAHGENCSHNIFCMQTWVNCSNDMYCNLIVGCKNCFGCSGLKHKEYCILNKQYTKEEYEQLVPKIIEKMKADGEWGEYFPFAMSPFAFNESFAQEFYPVTKERVAALGCRWKESTDLVNAAAETVDSATLPTTIDAVGEDICAKVIKCKESGRLYQIQKGELAFYKSRKIPLPQLHWETRHMKRVEQRNPFELWARNCACQGECQQHSGQCPNKFETSYSPDRPEKVYCESCYQKSVL